MNARPLPRTWVLLIPVLAGALAIVVIGGAASWLAGALGGACATALLAWWLTRPVRDPMARAIQAEGRRLHVRMAQVESVIDEDYAQLVCRAIDDALASDVPEERLAGLRQARQLTDRVLSVSAPEAAARPHRRWWRGRA